MAPDAAPRPRLRRLRTTEGALALALLGATLATGCTAKQPRGEQGQAAAEEPPDALEFVPAAATAIMHIDPRVVAGSWVYEQSRKSTYGAHKRLMEDAERCGISLDRAHEFVIATGPDDKTMAVLIGPGVGDLERLQCVAAPYAKEGAETPPMKIVTTQGGETVLELALEGSDAEQGARGYVVDERTVVFANKAWASDVALLTGGIGKRFTDSLFAGVIEQVDRERGVWYVQTEFPEDFSPGIIDVGDWKHLTMSADVRKGVDVSLSITTAGEERAKATHDQLRQMSQAMTMMIQGGFGQGAPDPGTEGEPITIKRTGSVVTVGVVIPEATLERMANGLPATAD